MTVLDQNLATPAIVPAVVGVARVLAMTVVAEGVETAEQYRALKALGCDGCQGFYFARPMSGPGVDALLSRPTRDTLELRDCPASA